MSRDAEYLRRINRGVGISNAIGVAGLAQQAMVHGELKQLSSSISQAQDEERAYRMAMWLQTPDGQAFARWRNAALDVASEIMRRSDSWNDAWSSEIARVIPKVEQDAVREDSYTPQPRKVLVQSKIGPWSVFVFLIAVLVMMNSYTAQSLILFLLSTLVAAASLGGAVWAALYRDHGYIAAEAEIKKTLATRRIEHFGMDPIDESSMMPTWSVRAQHLVLLETIKRVLSDADVEFPAPASLPALDFPQLVEPDSMALESHKQLLHAWSKGE